MKYDYEANKHKLVDARGVRLTSGLFEELSRGDTGVTPVFKLSDWRRVYVEVADPSDYNAAMALIGDWEHWQLLLKSPGFSEEVAKWRIEVEAKLRSNAIASLVKQSRLPTGTAAAKWLAEGGFAQRDKRTARGKKEADQADSATRQAVSADAKRLGLVAVK